MIKNIYQVKYLITAYLSDLILLSMQNYDHFYLLPNKETQIGFQNYDPVENAQDRLLITLNLIKKYFSDLQDRITITMSYNISNKCMFIFTIYKLLISLPIINCGDCYALIPVFFLFYQIVTDSKRKYVFQFRA